MTRPFKDNLYAQLARLGKALSSPKRLEILDLLAQGPRTVESVAFQTDQSIPNASQHLLALKAAGLLSSTKSGLHVTYRLADPSVATFLLAFRQLAESQIADIERLCSTFFADSPSPVSAEELSDRLDRSDIVLLDVRPRE
jgi:DNA-binding transcriptional ArsR family regulator